MNNSSYTFETYFFVSFVAFLFFPTIQGLVYSDGTVCVLGLCHRRKTDWTRVNCRLLVGIHGTLSTATSMTPKFSVQRIQWWTLGSKMLAMNMSTVGSTS